MHEPPRKANAQDTRTACTAECLAHCAPVPCVRSVELLEECPDMRNMLLCINMERRELQEWDKRVPVVRECMRGRRRHEGDKERRGDIGDLGTWGGAKYLSNCLALASVLVLLLVSAAAEWR